jgi:hypothetical protein
MGKTYRFDATLAENQLPITMYNHEYDRVYELCDGDEVEVIGRAPRPHKDSSIVRLLGDDAFYIIRDWKLRDCFVVSQSDPPKLEGEMSTQGPRIVFAGETVRVSLVEGVVMIENAAAKDVLGNAQWTTEKNANPQLVEVAKELSGVKSEMLSVERALSLEATYNHGRIEMCDGVFDALRERLKK